MSHGDVMLGIETSCDETGAALVSSDGEILANVLDSQIDVHAQYGGVVPELASRRHMETLETVVRATLEKGGVEMRDVRAIAVTQGPGLAGALVVGVNFAKALAYALNCPLLAVNHLRGHLASTWIEHPAFVRPAVMLAVSGGHTHLYYTMNVGEYELIGHTIDDAAGEAFDKGAKMLRLPYPGGPAIDRLATQGNANAVMFPRPYLNRGEFNFSFSGLKTALLYYVRDHADDSETRASTADLAASYQEAIVDVLVEKTFRAVHRYQAKGVAIVGGVAANSRLRDVVSRRAQSLGVDVALPSRALCTDNAVMIAAAGWEQWCRGSCADWELDIATDASVGVT